MSTIDRTQQQKKKKNKKQKQTDNHDNTPANDETSYLRRRAKKAKLGDEDGSSSLWSSVDIDTDKLVEVAQSNINMSGLISLEEMSGEQFSIVKPKEAEVIKPRAVEADTQTKKRSKRQRPENPVDDSRTIKPIQHAETNVNNDTDKLASDHVDDDNRLETDNADDNNTDETNADDDDYDLASLSPSAWDRFDLHPFLRRGLHKLGFASPTPIQAECLPAAIVQWKDIIGAAVTGSGKTLAFGIPIVQRLLTLHDALNDKRISSNKPPLPLSKMPLFALILSPTRELALQIVSHIQAVSHFVKGLNVVSIVGGMSAQKQSRLLRSHPHIIVATPGRLYELISAHEHDVLDGKSLAQLRFLVLDEADRMIAQGHFAELDKILAFIHKHRRMISHPQIQTTTDDSDNTGETLSTDTRAASANNTTVVTKLNRMQVMLFSATMTLSAEGRQDASKSKYGKNSSSSNNNDDDNMIVQLTQRLHLESSPYIIDLSSGRSRVVSTLSEEYINCLTEDKDYYVYAFLSENQGKRILIFVNSIGCLRRLVSILTILNIKVYGLHAEMQQRQRLKNLDRFKVENNAVIICTDIAARGIDIPAVPIIIHYQLPRTSETYIHRVGRTARAGCHGMSLAIIGESSTDTYNWKRINNVLASTDRIIQRYDIPLAMMKRVRERMSIARQIDIALNSEKKTTSHRDWFQRHAAEMDMIVDEELAEKHDEDDEEAKSERSSKVTALTAQLKRLLSEPLDRLPKHNNFFTLNIQRDILRDAAKKPTK